MRPALVLLLLLLSGAVHAGEYPAFLDRPAAGLIDHWRRFRAYPMFDLGYRHAAAGDSAAALAWLERGLERDDRAEGERYNLALIALGAHRPKLVFAATGTLIERQADFAAAWLLRGLARIETGEVALARRDLGHALALGNLLPRHAALAHATLALLSPWRDQDGPARLIAARRLDDRIIDAPPGAVSVVRLRTPRLSPRPLLDSPSSDGAPDPVAALNAEGYNRLRDGDDEQALTIFAQSLARDPDQSLIQRQLGYLLAARGRNREAAAAFRHALKLGNLDEDQAYRLRATVAELEERFSLSAYTLYRDHARNRHDLNLLGPSLGQSQGALEADVLAINEGTFAKLRPTLFGRLLWGYQGDGVNLDHDSLQAGVGVRWKPIATLNLQLGAERLIAVGDAARNNWMLRAAYSTGAGYGVDPTRRSWTHWHFYTDAAMIDPADPDLILAAETRLGQSFKLSERTVITPYWAANALFQDADGDTSLAETGPGLLLHRALGGDAYRAPLSALDFRLEYRFKLAGDSSAASGLALSLILRY